MSDVRNNKHPVNYCKSLGFCHIACGLLETLSVIFKNCYCQFSNFPILKNTRNYSRDKKEHNFGKMKVTVFISL